MPILPPLMSDASHIAPAVDGEADLEDVDLPASCPAITGGQASNPGRLAVGGPFQGLDKTPGRQDGRQDTRLTT